MINKNQEAKLILDEMQNYLNSAKYTLFSNTQIVVDRIRMEEFMQQLRQCIGEDDFI
ncbi:MAG: hypothetical protein Q4C59_03875 [Lachnospiraceae bacterium]|nr:hypothetical protein [Lachnospiraceae bacterium]